MNPRRRCHGQQSGGSIHNGVGSRPRRGKVGDRVAFDINAGQLQLSLLTRGGDRGIRDGGQEGLAVHVFTSNGDRDGFRERVAVGIGDRERHGRGPRRVTNGFQHHHRIFSVVEHGGRFDGDVVGWFTGTVDLSSADGFANVKALRPIDQRWND